MTIPKVTISTPLGDLTGTDQGDVHVFRGIRYAEPPTGPLRFKLPVPTGPWTGTLDATRFGPIPPQPDSRLNLVMGDFKAEQSEDCLSLNVWKPASADKPLPVLFWIHGGAFSSGAGSLDWYSGESLARRYGVIVVTINYRLGALGWLRIPGVSDGNLGLHDQIAALRWVKNNIEAFGGDPDAITVAGQSAGGLSIALLMASDACKDLFARAILQSAPMGMTPPSASEAETTTGELMAILGLEATDTDALIAVPADKLLAASRTLGMAKKRFGRGGIPIAPIVDGKLITRTPLEVAAAGELADIDIVIGTVREEMMAFFQFDPDFDTAGNDALVGYYTDEFGDNADAQLEETKRRYPGGGAMEFLSEVESDLRFHRPSITFAEHLARQGRAAFVYSFTWQSPMEGLRSCHCLELPFVFGNPEAWTDAPMMANANRKEVDGLSTAIQSAWASFVKSGNPSNTTSPAWLPYDTKARLTMCLDREVGPVSDAAGLAWRMPPA